jgi:tetratricopeptide (TPR) repeat protein
LSIDPENPHGHLGLARIHLARRENRVAAEAALRSIGLFYQYAMAHYCLGVALYRLGHVLASVDALQVAVSINPNFAEAHLRLASIYRHSLGEPERAAEHGQLAREMRSARRRAVAAKQEYKSRSASRLSVPPAAPSAVPARPTAAPGTTSTHGTIIEADPSKFITVVSGLPRSGTSMVMQMLAAGGMPVLVDGRRKPDGSNPLGYLEYERVKNLRADNAWLGEAQGCAIKIIAQLLIHLPLQYRYRVLFVDRDLDEIIASQRKMLAADGQLGARISDAQLMHVFQKQVNRVRRWLADEPRIDVLTVAHHGILTDPETQACRVREFLDGDLDIEKMVAAVDPALYRNRRMSGVPG